MVFLQLRTLKWELFVLLWREWTCQACWDKTSYWQKHSLFQEWNEHKYWVVESTWANLWHPLSKKTYTHKVILTSFHMAGWDMILLTFDAIWSQSGHAQDEFSIFPNNYLLIKIFLKVCQHNIIMVLQLHIRIKGGGGVFSATVLTLMDLCLLMWPSIHR